MEEQGEGAPLCRAILVCPVSPWNVCLGVLLEIPKSSLILYPGPVCPVKEGQFLYAGLRVPVLKTENCYSQE